MGYEFSESRKRTRYREQRGRCFFCWLRMHDGDATWEHLVARAHGGDNRWSNLVLAHSRCNGLVGTLPFYWKLALSDIGATFGSDAFFLLASSMKGRANSHARTAEHVRRPKRPPPHRYAPILDRFVAQLPDEMRLAA